MLQKKINNKNNKAQKKVFKFWSTNICLFAETKKLFVNVCAVCMCEKKTQHN